MRIVMISDLESKGGAAIAATRLAQGLVDREIAIVRIVFEQDGEPHPWPTIEMRPGFSAGVIARHSHHRVRNRFAERKASRDLEILLDEIRPDFINLHNLHRAASFGWSPEFLRVAEQFAPAIWTLHDMWSFTGRCAYSYDCRKFLSLCDSGCPTPNEYPTLNPLQIAGAWRFRKQILTCSGAVAAVTPSTWLADEARAGLWRGRRVEHIPNGLPLHLYEPIDRGEARRQLGLGGQGPYLLIASQLLDEKRKGGELLPDVLSRLRNLTVITVGRSTSKLLLPDSVRSHHLGFVSDPRKMVLAYNAADLLLHPAPVDNLPNVVMEAIACGTPVVAFRTGGVPEMVREGSTGWLAEELTSSALGQTLIRALDEVSGNDLRSSCRGVAEDEYDVEVQADRYLELFRSMKG